MTDPFLSDPAPATVTPAGPPVFGSRDYDPEAVRYKRFDLEVEHGRERFVSYFEVFPDIDGGALFSLMNARTQAGQGNAVAALLSTQLRDDDGVPSDWRLPESPAMREDVNPDDPEVTEDDLWERNSTGAPLYERWDGELVTADDLAFDEVEEGSSRRRFAFLMDSTRYRVKYDALAELAQWLVKEAVARPTKRSAPSRTGPQRTRRGAGAAQR